MEPDSPSIETELSDQSLTVLSAFTGAGGLDLGLEKAGFQIVGCIEQDKRARDTLQLNRPQWPLLEPHEVGAVTATGALVNICKPRKLSLLAGGPPCQPFSKAAQWAENGCKGLDDERASGLSGFFSIAEQLLPAAILIENVPGFVKGRTSALAEVRRRLALINEREGTSYRADWRVVNAVDFGVPQKRRRAIFIALRDGGTFNWPEATHRGRPTRAFDAIGDLGISEVPRASGKWAGLLASIPEGQNYLWHTPEGEGRPLFGYRTRFWSFLLKLAKDEPSWTLPASPGPSTGPFHWDNRPLAPRELLRLQSFPRSWSIAGTYREQVLQIGNATPPLLAEVFGRAIALSLGRGGYRKRPALHIRRRRQIPPAAKVRPVPDEYRQYEADHDPHPGPGKGPRPISPVED